MTRTYKAAGFAFLASLLFSCKTSLPTIDAPIMMPARHSHVQRDGVSFFSRNTWQGTGVHDKILEFLSERHDGATHALSPASKATHGAGQTHLHYQDEQRRHGAEDDDGLNVADLQDFHVREKA